MQLNLCEVHLTGVALDIEPVCRICLCSKGNCIYYRICLVHQSDKPYTGWRCSLANCIGKHWITDTVILSM